MEVDEPGPGAVEPASGTAPEAADGWDVVSPSAAIPRAAWVRAPHAPGARVSAEAGPCMPSAAATRRRGEWILT
jgi:hypothetical protein